MWSRQGLSPLNQQDTVGVTKGLCIRTLPGPCSLSSSLFPHPSLFTHLTQHDKGL